MTADEVIRHHVKRARRHNHTAISTLRATPTRDCVADVYKRARDEHMAMARKVAELNTYWEER